MSRKENSVTNYFKYKYWTGGNSESWINIDKLGRARKYVRVESRAEIGKLAAGDFYLMSVDVGRLSANTAIHVFRVHATKDYYRKYLVYTEVMQGVHFNDQSIRIKQLHDLYFPREVVVDGTGLGIGLIDQLVMVNTDPQTGVDYPALGVINDEEYIKRQDPTVPRVVYVLKLTASNIGEVHSNCFIQLSSNRVTFLVNERIARERLLATKRGQKMNMMERAEFLLPYEMTSRLFDEIGNLRMKPRPTGTIDVEQISRRIFKDRFSALEYGLWRIKYYEDAWLKQKHRRSKNMSDFLFFTPKQKTRRRR